MNTEVLWGGGGLLARPPRSQNGEQVENTDKAIAIYIRIWIVAAPCRNNCKHIVPVNERIAVGIRADRALVTDSVAAVVDPAAIVLIRIVPAHHRIRQRGAAVEAGL